MLNSTYERYDHSEVTSENSSLCSLDTQESFPEVSETALSLFETQIGRLKILWETSQANMDQAELEREEVIKEKNCYHRKCQAALISGSIATGTASASGLTVMIKGCMSIESGAGCLMGGFGGVSWLFCGVASFALCGVLSCSFHPRAVPLSKEQNNVIQISKCLALMNVTAPLFKDWKALKESLASDTTLDTKKMTATIESFNNVLNIRQKVDQKVFKKLSFLDEIFELIEESSCEEDKMTQKWRETIKKLEIKDVRKVFQESLDKDLDPCPELQYARATVLEYIYFVQHKSSTTQVDQLLEEINRLSDEVAPLLPPPAPELPFAS